MAKIFFNMNKAAEAWMEEETNTGRLSGVWLKTDNSGMVMIWEVESNDVLSQKLAEKPASSFIEYAVTPLSDMKAGMENQKGHEENGPIKVSFIFLFF